MYGEPWILRRRVKWGECDPAGVVYTPRYADYVAEAHLAFFEHLFAAQAYEVLEPLQMALPAKAIAIEYKRSLWPNEWFEMHVSVGDIRTRSYDIKILACIADGVDVFVATLSLVCLDRTAKKAVPIPQFLRDRLLEFRAATVSKKIAAQESASP